MQPKYEVPIIPHNLRREETIVQIAEALQYLSEVSTDIFARINTRIAQNKVQVSKISDRIQTASTKLNKLAGAKKATQVFSSAKYPAQNINRPYKSIFDNEEVLPVKKLDYEYKSSQVGDENLEPLQFYYVKVKPKHEKSNLQGLGDVPSDIETINDILLFNTGRNAYDKDQSHDKLNNNASNANKRGKDDGEVDIGAAPFSISQQGQGLVQKAMGENYFYSPHLGNVPTIDVPLDLPDLPGIADDLRYIIEQEPNIAPSVSNLHGIHPALANVPNFIPDLPEIEDDVIKGAENGKKFEKSVPSIPVSTAVDIPVATSSGITTKQDTSSKSQDITQDVVKNAQIPNVIPIKTENIQKPASAPQLPVITSSDHGRASLMDAIRNAGGSKSLKPKKEIVPIKEPPPTGDLMADLHAKLSMRRKGISGNKADNPTTMDRISEMIPPPPTTQSDKSSADEEDWDD